MKKIFMVFALMAMLMLPFTSFSMTAMEEGDLSSVTGQAGVSINLDARVDMYAKTVAWGDVDGFGKGTAATLNVGEDPDLLTKANAGWVGLSELAISNLRVRADQTLLSAEYYSKGYTSMAAADVTTFSNAATALGTALSTWYANPANVPPAAVSIHFNPGNTSTWDAVSLGAFAALNGGATFGAEITAFSNAKTALGADISYLTAGSKVLAEEAAGWLPDFAPLTIDVATDATYGAAVTYVRIGLGALQVTMDSMKASAALGPDTAFASGIPNLKYQLGDLYLGALALRLDGRSYVDIFTARGANTQGVTIAANVRVKELTIGTLAWGDKDGIDWAFDGTGKLATVDADLTGPAAAEVDAGYVGLKNLSISKMEVIGKIGIDVATNAAAWTFVQIDLGADLTNALQVKFAGMTATAALGADATTVAGLDQELGELYVGALTVKVYGALKLGARADGTQGVDIDLAQMTVAIDPLNVSWGDLDGIAGAKRAGYVGLKALTITGLALQGKVAIDVATVSTLAGNPVNLTQLMYDGYVRNNVSPTFVHIGLGSGDATTDGLDGLNAITSGSLGVSITNLTANVVFANNAAMTNTPAVGLRANTLGSVYVDTLRVGMNGWVDIAAH